MMKTAAKPVFKKNRISTRKLISRILIYAVLIAMSILFILPFYWMFIASVWRI